MKLPGGAHAIVDIAKLRDYCLDPHHPRGRHKARVFLSSLGLRQAGADLLRAALLRAARDEDTTPGESDEYGARYTVDFRVPIEAKPLSVAPGSSSMANLIRG